MDILFRCGFYLIFKVRYLILDLDLEFLEIIRFILYYDSIPVPPALPASGRWQSGTDLFKFLNVLI